MERHCRSVAIGVLLESRVRVPLLGNSGSPGSRRSAGRSGRIAYADRLLGGIGMARLQRTA
jgi:hypothetical protein